MSDLLIAVVAGLGGMLGWGFADFFAKKTIDEVGDVASLTWAHIFGTLGFLAAFLYRFETSAAGSAARPDAATWAGLVFFGVLQAVVYLLVYRGFGKGQLALLNPIFSSFSGIVALISIVFFGELVSGYLVLALLVVFLGVIFISVDPAALRERRMSFSHVPGFWEVGLATLLAALWTISWDRFIMGKDWLLYALGMYLFMTAFLWIYALARSVPLRVPRPGLWVFLVLIGLCETVAYFSISWGYGATSHASIVAILSGAFSLPTIVLARAFLKERTTRVQTLGSALIILGVVLLPLL